MTSSTWSPAADVRCIARQRVVIVAELTTNHFGDTGRLRTMIDLARAAGADAVKLQKRDLETFYTSEQLEESYESPFGRTFGEYRRGLELEEEQFQVVDRHCRALGIPWFASVLDPDSYEFMTKHMGLDLLKIPSTISTDVSFLDYVSSAYEGSLVVSTGMTDESYEQDTLRRFGDLEDLYLLHCVSAYPARGEDCNINVVRRYARLSHLHENVIAGYSSHELGSFGSVLAAAVGARMIEKHVKLGTTEWAHFDSVALDLGTSAFSDFVADIRAAERTLGSSKKTVLPSEHHKYWHRAAVTASSDGR